MSLEKMSACTVILIITRRRIHMCDLYGCGAVHKRRRQIQLSLGKIISKCQFQRLESEHILPSTLIEAYEQRIYAKAATTQLTSRVAFATQIVKLCHSRRTGLDLTSTK